MEKIIIVLLSILLSGCSMTHHIEKAVKKGYRVEQVTKEVRFIDTLRINGKDSIIERFVSLECPEPVIETKWKTRFDNRRFKDSLNVIRRMYSDSLDNAAKIDDNDRKENKQDNKSDRVEDRQNSKGSRIWMLVSICLFILLFIRYKK